MKILRLQTVIMISGLFIRMRKIIIRLSNTMKSQCRITIKLFGENHQDIAQSYLNIGLTYLRMGDYSKALEMYRKSLPILLQLFGENHSYVAENYMYIGNVYRYKGDYNQALEYLQKSLTIWKNLFGAKHPSIGEII